LADEEQAIKVSEKFYREVCTEFITVQKLSNQHFRLCITSFKSFTKDSCSVIFDFEGDELKLIQKRRCKDGRAHLFSFIYKFYSPVSAL
jgi:hypothetical protein